MQNLKHARKIKQFVGQTVSPPVSYPVQLEREGDRCYYFSITKQNWTTAENFRENNGGHLECEWSEDLISPPNYILIKETNLRDIWVRGTDHIKERNWTWTDCSPWSFTRWGKRGDHQQPDNSIYKDDNGDDCLLFPGNKSNHIDWADATCNAKQRQFVCSKRICAGKTCCFQLNLNI